MLLHAPRPMLRSALLGIFGASVGFFSIFGVAGSSAVAQTDEKTARDDRFIYEQVDEGILRLDSRTGEVSLCARRSTGWACRLVADEYLAIDSEVSQLRRENMEMRKLLADREAAAPAPKAAVAPEPKAEPPGAQPQAALPATTEKPAEKPVTPKGGVLDLSRPIEVVDNIWRRLVEMMANVKTDLLKRT